MSYIRVRNTIKVIEKKVTAVYFAERIEEIEYKITKGEKKSYKAIKGDYLSTIAKKYNISVSKLKKDNDLKNDSVKIGQSFIIKENDKKEEKGKNRQKKKFS